MEFNSKMRWVYLTGFFLILFLPLLNLPPLFSPPDWGKTIIFRIILSILIFVFIWQILSRKVVREPFSDNFSRGAKVILFLLLALFGIFLLATLFSMEPLFSLWGNPYRAGGFVNFAFYIVFAILGFLVIRKNDWQKIWDFSIFIGILVCVIAIFQQFGVLKEIFVFTERRPPSTIGITTALAIYLLLLTFLTLAFGIKTSWRKWFGAKKIFYFLALILFILVSVFITQTRSAYIGLAIGFLYFLFFYPIPFLSRRSILIKTSLVALLALIGFAVYYVNTQPDLPQFIEENKILKWTTSRFSIKAALADPRISGWPIAWEAIKARPILGYGPENFAIGFDKFYDPALPLFIRGGMGSWWDRAHNIFLDTAGQAGILAFIIYLSLFIALFWQLRKIKKERPLIAHGIQATLLAYFAANIFSFDVFSTYLIFFLLVGYSLTLINESVEAKPQQFFMRGKKPIAVVLFCLLVWFIWSYNIKPLQINTQINIALYQAEKGNFEGAVAVMENILPRSSFIDNYLRLQYVSVIGQAIEKNPETAVFLAPRAYEILKENIKIRPYYTRNWMLLGYYTNVLISQTKDSQPEVAQKLKEEAEYYLKKASELSPKRQEVLVEWIKTDILSEKYEAAKEKAQKCIDYNPEFRECYWQMTLINIYLGNEEEAEKYYKITKEKKYPLNSEIALLQLANAYIKIEDYQKLAETYQKLVKLMPEKIQYRASLAVCYQKLGQIEKAKEEALKVLEISPESKEMVEEFLRELE